MTLETWIIVWLQIGLVSLAALLFVKTRAHASVRQAVGRCALLLTPVLLLIASSSWREDTRLPPAPISFATPAAKYVERSVPAPSISRIEADSSNAETPVAQQLSLAQVLTYSWGLVALFFLARIGLGMLACRRLRSLTQEANDNCISAIMSELGSNIQVRTGKVSEPILTGIRKPTLFLPNEFAAELSDDRLRSVLVHEVAHVQNRDLQWRLYAELLSAILWPQPGIRLLTRALSHCDEERCDQEVLASGVKNADYAGFLVDLAGGHRPKSQPIGSVAFSSGLGKRVKTLLKRGLPAPRKLTRRGRFAVVTVQVMLLLAAVGFVGAARSTSNVQAEFKALTHKFDVKILDVDGKPLTKGVAYLDRKGFTNDPPIIEVPIKDGIVTIDPAVVKDSFAVILLVKSDASALSFGPVWGEGKETKELKLVPPATVTGRILNPDGKPAGNTKVTSQYILKKEGEYFATFRLPENFQTLATTNPEGKFTTNLLATGSRILLDCPDLTDTANTNRSIQINSDSFDAGDVKFDLGASVSGRVIRDGKPVAGVTIGAQSDGQWGSAVTDSEGRYTLLRLPADKYNIALMLSPELEKDVTARAHEGVNAEPGKPVTSRDFDLIPGAVIRGKVTKSDGKPVPKIQIGIYGPARPRSGAWVQMAVTDDKGEYMLRVPGGDQFVYIMQELGPQGEGSKTSKEVTVKDGETMRVDLELP